MSFPISTPTTFSNDGVTQFLNITDTSNLTTSSVVFSGGIAVTKNMYTGGNIGMVTGGGTISISPTSQANVTITVPSLGGTNDTMVFTGLAQTLSNKSLNNTSVFHVDGTDATKRIGFQTSGASTGTTLTLAETVTANRTITFPDPGVSSSNVVLTDSNQTINDTKTFSKNIIVSNGSFSGSAMGSTASATADNVLAINETFIAGDAVKAGLKITVDTTTSGTFSQPRGIDCTVTCSGAGASIPACVANVLTARLNTSLNIASDRVSTLLLSAQSTASQTGTIGNIKLLSLNPPTYTGSKPTDNIGMFISNQGVSGITNAYGIQIAAQSGATNNYGISSAAPVAITDTTTSSSTTTGALTVAGGIGCDKHIFTPYVVLTDTNPIIVGLTNTRTLSFPTPGSSIVLTFPTSTDTMVGRATTDTLTNKTLTSPIISTIVNTGTLTLPTSTDTLVGRATTDTLTNKSLTNASVFFVDGTVTTKRIGFQTSGATASTTLTLAGIQTTNRTITFPDATDQVVCRATTDTLTNKTLTSPNISTIVNTGTLTLPTSTDTLVGRATTDTLTNKTITSTTNNVAANILNSATTAVNVSAATAPSAGQTLVATSSTTATWQNLIFGYQSDTTIYSTTSTAYVTLKTFTTASLTAGNYLLSWYIEVGNSVAASQSSFRIVQSPSTVLGECLAIDGTYTAFTGFIRLASISGALTFNIDALRITTGNTARIRNSRIYLQYSS